MSKLTELREMCEGLGIEWHHRNKEETLARMIEKHATDPTVVRIPKPEPEPVVAEVAEVREKRGMPSEVSEALDYFNSHKRCNARVVREFIESIL